MVYYNAIIFILGLAFLASAWLPPKSANDKMANTADAADKSFAFAAQNCRDCTKITCEAKD